MFACLAQETQCLYPKVLAIKRPDTHSYLWECTLYMHRSFYEGHALFRFKSMEEGRLEMRDSQIRFDRGSER